MSPRNTSERLQHLLHDAPHFGGCKELTETRRSNLLEQPRGLGIERITGQENEARSQVWVGLR